MYNNSLENCYQEKGYQSSLLPGLPHFTGNGKSDLSCRVHVSRSLQQRQPVSHLCCIQFIDEQFIYDLSIFS